MRGAPKVAACTIARNGSPNQSETVPVLSQTATDRHAKGAVATMRRLIGLSVLLVVGLWAQPASAQGLLTGLLNTVGQVLSTVGLGPQPGVIVRTNLGLAGLQNACLS